MECVFLDLHSPAFAGTSSSSGSSSLMGASTNLFMPHKKILRSDGASLIDVYESKKADTWGQIIKAQYLADEEQKKINLQNKHKRDEEYGRKLRDQLREIEEKRQFGMKEESQFAALEDATVSYYLFIYLFASICLIQKSAFVEKKYNSHFCFFCFCFCFCFCFKVYFLYI